MLVSWLSKSLLEASELDWRGNPRRRETEVLGEEITRPELKRGGSQLDGEGAQYPENKLECWGKEEHTRT